MEKKRKEKESAKRILGYRLAKELSSEDMKIAVGGCTISYDAPGIPGDADEMQAY